MFLKDQLKDKINEQTKDLPTLLLPGSILKKYIGDWFLGPPANKVFSFTVDSGHLTCHIGSLSFALEGKTDHQFYFAADNSIIDFSSLQNFDYKSSTVTIPAKKITSKRTLYYSRLTEDIFRNIVAYFIVGNSKRSIASII
jgi:hypothetical protein